MNNTSLDTPSSTSSLPNGPQKKLRAYIDRLFITFGLKKVGPKNIGDSIFLGKIANLDSTRTKKIEKLKQDLEDRQETYQRLQDTLNFLKQEHPEYVIIQETLEKLNNIQEELKKIEEELEKEKWFDTEKIDQIVTKSNDLLDQQKEIEKTIKKIKKGEWLQNKIEEEENKIEE